MTTYTEEHQQVFLQILIADYNLYLRCCGILQPTFFDARYRKVVRFIMEYVESYKALPLPEIVHAATGYDIQPLSSLHDSDREWFLNEIENFCRHKMLDQMILDGPDLISQGQYGRIEEIAKAAMTITLNRDLGIDYFEKPKQRLERVRDSNPTQSTGWRDIDYKLYGGWGRQTLNIFAGQPGCVTADTNVVIVNAPRLISAVTNHPLAVDERVSYLMQFYSLEQLRRYVAGNADKLQRLWQECQPRSTSIVELSGVERSASTVWVTSPDGWVPVVGWWAKGVKEIYTVILENGMTCRASHDHLFQTEEGEWVFARDLSVGVSLLCDGGSSTIRMIGKTGEEDVYDLSIGHANHRYYTDGICSHNSGKSLFLQNISLNYIEMGMNVIYFTLEMSEDQIAMRFDTMVSGYGSTQLMKNLDDVELKIAQYRKRKKPGILRLKKFPEGGTTVNHLRSYLKEYEIQTGIKFDVIAVDYLDLLTPNSKRIDPSNLFVKDKYTSEELRALAFEWNAIVVTASQLNRSSMDVAEFEQSSIAGGISKVNTADNVLALYATAAMKERGEYMVQFLKTRTSAGVGSKIILAFDPDSLRISDKIDSGSGTGGHTTQTSTILSSLNPNLDQLRKLAGSG